MEMPTPEAPIVEWAVWYASLGYRVFPCAGKVPAIPTQRAHKKGCQGVCGKWGHGFYDGTTDSDTIKAMWANYPGSNIGVRTGNGLVVLDFDAEKGGSITAFEAAFEVLPPTVTCLTGSGGGSQHTYLRLRIEGSLACATEWADGVDIRADGGYVIVPPSIHPDTGRVYQWEADRSPEDIQVADAPYWLVPLFDIVRPERNGHAATPAAPVDPHAVIYEGRREATLLKVLGAMQRNGASPQAMRAYAEEENARCEPHLDAQDLERLVNSIQRYEPEPQMHVTKPHHVGGWRNPEGIGHPTVAGNTVLKAEPANDDTSWHKTEWFQWSLDPYIVNKKGKIEANNGTIMAVLRNHTDWAGRLWWDDFASKMFRGSRDHRTELEEDHLTLIGAEFADTYYIGVSSDRLMERCLYAAARLQRFDPLQEYLGSLPGWDMEKRLETWLLDCAGLADSAYHRFCSRNLIVSMIVRALDPGCICRSVLILEGPEEYRKSTFVSHLVPYPEWFDEISGSLDSKEAHLMVQGLWVAELSELDSLGRTEETRLKSFISLRYDAHIPKFKNMRVSPPRRTIFVGTTNEAVYFKSTGNTRFLPVKILQPMDIEGFLAIREQLFAEALVYYHDHPNIWWQMDETATVEAQAQREQRRDASIIEDDFAHWLYRRRFEPQVKAIAELAPLRGEVSWPEIAVGYYGLLTRKDWKDSAYHREAKKALRALGWYPNGNVTRKTNAGLRIDVRTWGCDMLETAELWSDLA
jgi:hypothetical protein